MLILDDFGMQVLDSQQMLDLMEIMQDRHGVKSTIIASQLAEVDWYDILNADTTTADAILDWIVHTAQRFVLKRRHFTKKNEMVLNQE
ncbi:MAG: ATP-binding protein [Bacteroidales bacterium]|nr:ATP-binding protein [Bacteroidales bacterium]